LNTSKTRRTTLKNYDKVTIITNRYIKLEVEGEDLKEQVKLFLDMHGVKAKEMKYEFLFFAKEWFETRGFKAAVVIMDEVKGWKRLLLKWKLKKRTRRESS